MEVGVLGPLVVRAGDVDVHLARQERVVLARLLLAGGRPVSDDALIDLLWGAGTPARATATLQGYIYRIRRSIGTGAVERRHDGYAIAGHWASDVDAVERGATDARRRAEGGDLDGAAEALTGALARFRGEPYDELDGVDAVRGERRRLDERRRQLAEELVDIDLARGRHGDVVARLEAVVADDPTDERAWSQLVTALAGMGRQADALAAAGRARRTLASELGISPGALLRAAEQAVLDHGDEVLLDTAMGARPRLIRDAAPDHGSLPAPVDSFVGRAAELAAIATAMHDHRLVSLVGPGGAGKTRLALEVARSESARHDRAWFVELAGVEESDRVPGATALAVGVGSTPDVDPIEALVRHLADRPTLVVLDNCEQVVDAVAWLVDELLARCSGLHIIATSREASRARGEVVVEVAPLAVSDGESAQPSPAATLFLDRAEAAAPGFDRRTASAAVVGEICRSLDGLPLALEIAAAQLRWLSLDDLAVRLPGRFPLSAVGARGEERQRTLEQVIAWSEGRLSGAEQAALRRLALLPDSFTLHSAEVLLAGSPVVTGSEADLVARLVATSLLIALPIGDGPRRYRMLATIRQYAAARRAALDQPSDGAERLVRWAVDVVAEVEAAIRTPRQDRAMEAAAVERRNLRAALDAALEMGDVRSALRIAAAVPLVGPFERERMLLDLLGRDTAVPPALAARAWAALSNIASDRGSATASLAAAGRCLAAAVEDGDRAQQAWARYYLVIGHWGMGDVGAAEEQLRAARREFEALALADGLAYLDWAGSLITADIDAARQLADRAVDAFRALDMPFGVAHALEARALVALRAGRAQDAVEPLGETIAILSSAGNAGCTAHGLEAAAACAADLGRVTTAAELLVLAEQLRRTTGYGHRVWEAHGRRHAEAALAMLDVSPSDRIPDADVDVQAMIAAAATLAHRALVPT